MASLLVLLVDDDELSLEITSLQMAAVGHAVWQAPTGARALEQLSEAIANSTRLPDAIITDLQMPDMNGHSLCRRIHKLAAHTPPVYAMSATRPTPDTLREFDGFLQKPLDVSILRQTFQDALRPVSGPPKIPPASSVVQMPDAPLDGTILQKLRVLMPPAALHELLTAYLKDTRSRLAQMERFADSGEEQALRSCAHMVKGSASMTGALRVARIAAQLESGESFGPHQKVLINELRCACDAIEGTLAREDRVRDNRNKEAHDHQVPRIG